MKILKIIGIIVLAIVAIGVVIGLVTPKDYNLNRSTVINAPADVIFKNISRYENFKKWSPWEHLDSNIVTSIEGTEGTVGSKYSWKGNDKVGEGSMELTKVEEGKSIEQKLEFLKPFKSSSTTYTNLEAAEGGTKVTWGMKGESSFVTRIFMTLMGGMDKAVGGDYERGLANLKTLCESSSATTSAYDVTEVDWAEKNCLAVREVVKFQDMGAFFGKNLPAMDEAIKKAGAKAGIAIGVYYKFNEEAMNADMAAAVPYEGAKVLAKGFSNLNLPAGKAYMINYFGDYGKMKPAYDAMRAKLKELAKEDALVVEEYISDPMTEKDTAKWETKIYFFPK